MSNTFAMWNVGAFRTGHTSRRPRPAAAPGANDRREFVSSLESRRLLAGTPIDGGLLAIATDRLIPAPRDFADTWQPLAKVTRPSAGARSYLNIDGDFDAFRLDAGDLRKTLALAPMEFTDAATRPVEVSIPAPDGTAARFAVVETMVMDPRLAAKFPGIKTYRGQGVDDAAATVRLDLTPLGFHAQVIAPGRTFYVDPYWHRNQGTYTSYWRTDVAASPENLALTKDVLAEHDAAPSAGAATDADAGAAPLTAERPSGATLRTYRTAVAATGEYTAFHGGTVSAGQAAIVTAINRVTGIYEKELSVRLTLVPNNSSLVFTNSSTDPYTNNNGGAMLSQNQSRIDSVIGSANYDIGHVFSTGGGGVAYLGVVGYNPLKAGGVTGLPSPTGDAFYVDYVAHEMGHQFGGDHTFNTSSDGNREPTAAYEPGSGSTIMAYAGITGPDSDLQNNSDPYFHWKSFDQIISYLDDDVPGVGTRTGTGNSVPAVNAGADRTIPAGTPFALTATGSDANGDALTYSWEQADLGPANLLTGADNGSSPLFRVYNPTTSPTRTFPRLPSVLAGSNNTHSGRGGDAATAYVERLPTQARAMDFRVTVRDNRAGGGGVNSDDVVVNVVNTGAGFAVNSFNSGGTLPGGSTQAVNWIVAGTTGNGINAANVDVLLSTDGGNTFPTVLAASTPNDGTHSVVIPNVSTSQARIKIQPNNNIFFDINNANLTITPGSISAAPGTPDLLAATDTGVLGTDNYTARDNSSAAKNLQFLVPGTVAGATVSVYADNVLIGTATSSGGDTTVTTNGSVDVPDGTRSITARQTQVGQTESANSAALSVIVDTVAPTANVVDVAPDPRSTGVAAIAVAFSEGVSGLDRADLSLTRDGSAVTLTSLQTVTTSDAITYSVNNLTALTNSAGPYVFTLTAAGSGIVDPAGNALAAGASDGWTNNNAAPTITSLTDAPDPVFPGNVFTLTANGVADPNGDGVNVAFYREANGTPGLQVSGGDLFLPADPGNPFACNPVASGTPGTYTFYSQATDTAGLTSAVASTTNTVQPNTSATPGTPNLNPSTDSGASDTDNITNFNNAAAITRLSFTVTGTVSGATVSIYGSDNVLLGSATATGTTTTVTTNGSAAAADGVHLIKARQTESGKGQSADSGALTVTIDTTAPAAPPAPDLEAASDSGASSTDNLTNDLTPTFTGDIGAPGSATTLRLFAGGTEVGNTTTATGAYAVTSSAITLQADPDDVSFQLRAIDLAGNVGPLSPSTNVTLDTQPPQPAFNAVSSPRTDEVPSVGLSFTGGPVTGFDRTDLTLTRDGVNVPLSAANNPTSANGIDWTIGGLAELTRPRGTYVLAVAGGAGSDIVDTAGNLAVEGDSETWVNNNPPPAVSEVFVSGSTWTQDFLDSAQFTGAGGNPLYGFALRANDHGDELPWANVNRVTIRFSENVNVAADDLVVRGVNSATYPLAAAGGFAYSPIAFTATWTLATAGLPADKLLLDLDAGAVTGVTDAVTGVPLDGEWVNPADTTLTPGGADAFPSGDGTPGGDFHFRANVLPGDVNRSGGTVNALDVTQVRSRLSTSTANPGTPSNGYTIFYDVNGDAVINAQDVSLTRNRQSTQLPAPEPTASRAATSSSLATFTGGGTTADLLTTLQSRREGERLTDGLL